LSSVLAIGPKNFMRRYYWANNDGRLETIGHDNLSGADQQAEDDWICWLH